MKPHDDKFWNPHPKVGELVKCANWTKFPGRVGQVLHVDMREGIYKEKGHINLTSGDREATPVLRGIDVRFQCQIEE